MAKLASSDCLGRLSQAVNDRGSGHFQAIVLYAEEREKARGQMARQWGGQTGEGSECPLSSLMRQAEIIKAATASWQRSWGGVLLLCIPMRESTITGPPFSWWGEADDCTLCRASTLVIQLQVLSPRMHNDPAL